MPGRRWKIIAGAIFSLVIGAGCAFSPSLADSFYDPAPSELRGRPGTIIRAEPFPGAPHGASAYRVLYRSIGLKGEPIAVSGVVVIPAGPAPASGREIVAWAHGTTGVARRCAPSLYPQSLTWIHGLEDMLARGYVVSATDFPGLGTPGVHPYLIGPSAGRSVLDSVRAARALPGADAGNRFAVWGHSQGGHAALFTGQIARGYAPELRLAGVAAAAPATELPELFRADIRNPVGKVLGAFALWSWSRVYNFSLDAVLRPTVGLVLDHVVKFCNDSQSEIAKLAFAAQALEREGFLAVDVTKADPWRKLMAENTPGQAPAGAPVFIAQGTTDPVVRPHVTEQFVGILCGRGTPVRYVPVPGGDHTASAKHGAGPAIAWIAERFAGQPPPSDCAAG
ncbi:MAG: lipase family protein [Xanthobacteraceae bacterium]